jgi:hypothetical protein
MREHLSMKRLAMQKCIKQPGMSSLFIKVDSSGRLNWLMRSLQNAWDRGFGLIIWIDQIKKIEGKFGSGVGSYFRFLRILLAMNVFKFVIR